MVSLAPAPTENIYLLNNWLFCFTFCLSQKFSSGKNLNNFIRWQKIQSIQTCNLDLLWLPHNLTRVNVILGLAHSSPISMNQFCDGECKVIFDEEKCKVYYGTQIILKGKMRAIIWITHFWWLQWSHQSIQQHKTQTKLSISATNTNTHIKPCMLNHIQTKINSIPPSMCLQLNDVYMDSCNW